MKARFGYSFAMMAFGTISLFVRSIPLPSSALALLRAAIAAVCILLLRALTGSPVNFRKIGRDALPLFASGAAMGFNWILLFEAYKYTTISIATLSYYFAPVLVTVLSTALFREKLTGRQIACFALSTLGLALVVAGGTGLGGGSFKGIAFGLGAAALYATVILLNKGIHSVSGTDCTVMQFLAAIVVLTPYVCLTDGVPLGAMDAKGWVCLAIVGIFHTGAMYCLYFTALRSLRGQEAAILSYIDPLVAVVISSVFLREPTSPLQLLGGAMILGFTLVNELVLQPLQNARKIAENFSSDKELERRRTSSTPSGKRRRRAGKNP